MIFNPTIDKTSIKMRLKIAKIDENFLLLPILQTIMNDHPMSVT